MSWNCINCEAANDYHHNRCEVCGYERYFSVSEVNVLLQEQEGEPTELKKLQASYKRSNTINKRLRDENKEMQSQLADLQKFKDTFEHELKSRQEELLRLRKRVFYFKISLVMSFLVFLFLALTKVTVIIN